MSDQTPDAPERDERPEGAHPVLWGLVALVSVAVVVGVIMGGGVLAVSKALGLDDDGVDTGRSTASQTLELPALTDPTESGDGSYLDITPGPNAGQSQQQPDPGQGKKKKEEKPKISLSAGQTAVGPMEQIDLTGVYPGGEGAILQVQQFKSGSWSDFPVTAPVSGDTFTTFIQTGNPGPNRFRMIDTDTGTTSNEVKVQVG